MDYKKIGLDKLGFEGKHQIYRNLPIEKIIEHSLLNKETQMGMYGATPLCANCPSQSCLR